MIIQYGDIRGCQLLQSNDQLLLAAPQGIGRDLLIRNGFVQMADGSWHHYLTAAEYQYIQEHWNDPEIVLQSTVQGSAEAPEDKKSAHTLCFISLGLLAGSWIIPFVTGILYALSEGDYPDVLTELVSGCSWLCSLAAFVFMIITRVKYPRNTFGKVLMWCYIGYIILQIILLVAVIIACSIGCAMCMDELSSCPG